MLLPADWFVNDEGWGLLRASMVMRGDDPIVSDCGQEYWLFGHEENRIKAWQRVRFYDSDCELRGMRTAPMWSQGWCCEYARDYPTEHIAEYDNDPHGGGEFDYMILACEEGAAEAVPFTHVWWVG